MGEPEARPGEPVAEGSEPEGGEPERVDRALVRRGLARSRGHAGELLRAGQVTLDGAVLRKPATPVAPHERLTVTADGPGWVGRAAGKLDAALTELGTNGPHVTGRRCIDLGASTGGFTQVLLQRGAREVVALDVGHDQLVPALRDDPRVVERSGTTLRGLRPEAVGGPFDLVVADLSFISLRLVLDEIHDLVRDDGETVLLVKPQFEVGRHGLGRRGVVRSAAHRRGALIGVLQGITDRGLAVLAVLPSRVTGGEGNREYLVHATRASAVGLSWQALVRTVDDLIQEEEQ